MQSLKISWIRRLLSTNTQPWASLFNDTIANKHKLIEFGSLYVKDLILKTTNNFWKTTFQAYEKYLRSHTPNNLQDKLVSPIWYNHRLPNTYQPDWYSKGISIVGDLLHTNLEPLSQIELTTKYNLKPTNALSFIGIYSSIRKYLRTSLLPPENNLQTIYYRPHIPFNIAPIKHSKKGIKYINRVFNIKKTYYNIKWNTNLQTQIDEDTWKRTYKICFNTVHDNYLIWLQYRILNRILGIRSRLYKLNMINSPQCKLCNTNDEETLTHLFYQCPEVKSLWKNIQEWIKNKLNIQINITMTDVILGYLPNNNFNVPMNTIILLTKAYIFNCSRKERNININYLQTRIHTNYSLQENIARINGKLDEFTKNWDNWKRLFD